MLNKEIFRKEVFIFIPEYQLLRKQMRCGDIERNEICCAF